MYEFNPMTSLELLQNMRQTTDRPTTDLIGDADDLERRVSQTSPCTLGDFVRRVFRRMVTRRRAA
jgi:hypothetical protein